MFKNKSKTTHVAIVQDRSGSMQNQQDVVISGFNEYIDELKKDNSDQVLVTLTQFDSTSEIQYESRPLEDVQHLNRDTFVIQGMTALYDAIGQTINSFKNKKLGPNDNVVLVIWTDGGENSSREYNQSQVQELIKSVDNDEQWNVIYMAANNTAWQGGANLGFRNNLNYAGKTGETYSSLAMHTNSLRGGASGQSFQAGIAKDIEEAVNV